MPSTWSWWLISFQGLQSINSDSSLQAHIPSHPRPSQKQPEPEPVSQMEHETLSAGSILTQGYTCAIRHCVARPAPNPSPASPRFISPHWPSLQSDCLERTLLLVPNKAEQKPSCSRSSIWSAWQFQSTNGKRKKDGLKSVASFYQTRTCSSQLTIIQ